MEPCYKGQNLDPWRFRYNRVSFCIELQSQFFLFSCRFTTPEGRIHILWEFRKRSWKCSL